ncbi:unnamed protein product, partial [Amoebophrya sp. A25]|eukprot:GSA25T00018732001.1
MSRPCPLGLGLHVDAPIGDKKCNHDKNLRASGPIFYKQDPWEAFQTAFRDGVLAHLTADSGKIRDP